MGTGVTCFFVRAERWLTPGTEYAIPEKLPLPREWYKDWDTDGSAAAASSAAVGSGAGGTDVDESSALKAAE
jgi:hypothetical protein